jgi:cyclic pyranopterin phosphate synthase
VVSSVALDAFGRRIDYLRIAVTDRCNLRCIYCMPEEGVLWKPPAGILSFEEIERFARIAVEEGISKIRLTGGEPLVRLGIVDHIRRLRELTGLESIALTTNGTLLERFAPQLAGAGLSRVNVSLDSLDPEVFSRVTRGGKLENVLAGIDLALEVGMSPVKLNVVVVRSLHQDLLEFARMTLDRPLHVRFIEYMPVGDDAELGQVGEGGACGGDTEGFHWTLEDHVPSTETLESLSAAAEAAGLGSLEVVARDEAPGGWGPARYYRLAGARGTIGVISPLSAHFCGECNRLRLTADGMLRACLFSDEEIDARTPLRAGTDAEVRDVIRQALASKPESHNSRIGTIRRMSQIGG